MRQFRLTAGLAVLSLLFTGAARAEEGGDKGPRPAHVSGTIKKIDGSTVTVPKRGEGGVATDIEITVPNSAAVVIETDEDEEYAGESGNMRKRPKTKDGTLADLKEGMRVSITYTESDKTATKVLVPRAAKKGGDGGKKEGDK